MAKRVVEIGAKYGTRVVLGVDDCRGTDRLETHFVCVCECGRVSSCRACQLVGPRATSGCRWCAKNPRRTIHGYYGSLTYASWDAAKRRCYGSNNAVNVRRYRNRGITMCESWKQSFQAFLNDMGERPSKSHSLDRIDNDGPYAPWNCRWATSIEQTLTRSNTHLIVKDGVSDSVAGWSRRLGRTRKFVYSALKRGEFVDAARP